MADKKNKQFRENPENFLTNHTIMVSPQQATAATTLAAGLSSLDIVPVDSSVVPQVVRLEQFNQRDHGWGANAISAYYLPAILNNTSTLVIGNAADYIFTADLSGCLFAAYGPNAQNITVEHVNVRNANAIVPIATRGAAILAANHAYCRIITPQPLGGGLGAANVVNYTTGGNVVGVRENGAWVFYYRLDQNPVGHF